MRPILPPKFSFTLNAGKNKIKFSQFTTTIYASAEQADGKLLIGGNFTDFNGGASTRSYFLRFNSDGNLDLPFVNNMINNSESVQTLSTIPLVLNSSKFGGAVFAIAVQSDGKILVGGSFSDWGDGSPIYRNCLLRLNSDGTTDDSFLSNAVNGPKFAYGSSVRAIVIQSDGKILVGGSFTDYNGVSGRTNLIRLNSDGTLDTAFCVNASDGSKFNARINTIAIESGGKILAGGIFTNYNGTATRNRLVRLNSDGTVDDTFCSNSVDGSKFSSSIESVTVQADGKIYVMGNFASYGGTSGRNYLIRLESTGVLDTTFCSNAVDGSKFNSSVFQVKVQGDGKLLVAGSFSSYAGLSSINSIIRLNQTGTLDSSFLATGVSSTLNLSLLSTGRIFLGYSNRGCDIINGDGSFNINPNENYFLPPELRDATAGTISCSAEQNQKLLVCGALSNYGKVSARSYMLRFMPNGAIDTSLASYSKFNNTVSWVAVQSDLKILAGGSFTDYDGVTGRSRLVRLNPDGTIDAPFCANASDASKFNAAINFILVQPDQKILVAGSFSNYGGVSGRQVLVRLNSDGTVDNSFCVNASDGLKFSNAIFSMALQSDGKILAVGSFINYAATAGRDRLIRLNSDGTVDSSFCSNASDGSKVTNTVNSVAVLSDGTIIFGGRFTSYGGVPARNYLMALNSDGTVASTFCSNAIDGKFVIGSGFVLTIAPDQDGGVWVGGGMSNYTATGRGKLIKLNSDGTLNSYCNQYYLSNVFNVISNQNYLIVNSSTTQAPYGQLLKIDKKLNII